MGNDHNSIDFLDEIEEIANSTDSHINRLIDISLNKDEEVRLRSLEALSKVRTFKAEERIREGLFDPDELVRITCLEALGSWRDRDSADQIMKCLSDQSWMVRAEASLALSEIGEDKFVDILKKNMEKANDEEKLRYYLALYRFGFSEYFSQFLNGLYHKNYRIRCATANLINKVVESSNKNLILNLLSAVLKSEKTKAATSSMNKAIEDISAFD